MSRARRVNLVVRRAVGTDAEALLPLLQAHARYERGTIGCTAAQLAESLEAIDPPLHAWIARSDAGLIGYSTATVDFSTWRAERFIHLDCLFVRERSRGLGVGRLLLNAAREYGRGLGLRHMEWQTPSWNVDAIRFYERIGAISQEKVRFQLQLD